MGYFCRLTRDCLPRLGAVALIMILGLWAMQSNAATVPTKYNYTNYLKNNTRAKGRTFAIPKIPARGKHVTEIFIKSSWLTLAPSIQGKGDGRSHNANFDPKRTRAFIVMDWAAGRG